MSKGSAPAGNTTVTQVNPTQQAQTPYLQNLWGAGQNALGGYAGTGGPDPFGLIENMQNYAANGMGLTTPGVYNDLAAMFPALGNLEAGGNVAQGAINNLNNTAANLPGQVNPYINALGQNASALSGMSPQALSQMQGLSSGALGGAQGYAGALGGLAPGAMASGNPAEMQLMRNAGMSVGGNPALGDNSWLASGSLLSPNSNPYLAGTFNAAAQPVVNQYMTATAPQTDSNFEAAGRYGSGANAQANSVNQQNLGQTLQNLASNIYGNAYGQGLNATTTAAGNLGSQYNTGVFNSNYGAGQAGSLAQGGFQLGGNLLNQAGNLGQQGYQNAANILNSGYGTAGNLLSQAGGLNQNAGSLGLNLGSELGSLYGNAGQLGVSGLSPELSALGMVPSLANMPSSFGQMGLGAQWQPLNQQSALLGNPVNGSQTTTQPYFQNSTANLLGGLTGGLGLLNGVNSAFSGGGALSGLFGGGSAVAGLPSDAAISAAGGLDIGGIGDAAASSLVGGGGGGGLFAGLGSLLGKGAAL